MKNIILGSLVSAVVLFIFGYAVWGTNLSSAGFGSGLDMEAMQQAIRESAPESGTYVIPDPFTHNLESFGVAHNAGPLGIMHITKEGAPPMQVSTLIMGFIHNFVTAMILAMLLQMAIPALPSYGGRVMFCVIVGLFAAVWENFSAPIWYSAPWAFFVVRSIYTIVSMAIVGAILARFIKE